mmetsp:Transcript_20601/g.48896  ORF Transcript_20601/g.48896 Transcript_20601/m.48896 type:complete len:251 (-) Transcript_20601:166-918(-)
MILDDTASMSSSMSVKKTAFKLDGPSSLDPVVRPPPGRIKRRHSVDFKPPAEPEVVEKYDEEARTLCWYSKDEYDIIKARNSLIVKMMKTGHFRESDEHSFRGLEHKLKEGFKQRRANKFNALNAVLEEQDRQVSVGVIEPEKIAKKYRRVSLNAAETALVVGMRDAEESMVYQPGAAPQPQRTVSPPPENNHSDAPSLQYDSYGNEYDTIASEESEQQQERVRLEVRGLFDQASKSKFDGGRMSRRSSM